MSGPAKPVTEQQAKVALGVLLLTYMVSYVDRTALGVLQEPIKHELDLTDWQLGLLAGPAFGVLYALMSLPVARLAERYNRSHLLAACLFFWSAMTLASGFCQTYTQLLLARIGISIGEAGSNPASHSLISDLFPPERRGRAISVYTLGIPLGGFLGAVISGWLAGWVGWRGAFILLGPMGFILVFAVLRLIPNVTRGRFDEAASTAVPGTWTVLETLAKSAIFRQLAMGATLVVVVGYGVASFIAPFLIRVHGLTLGEVGLFSGLINGAAAGVGTLVGGFAADHLGRRDRRFYGWLPGAMMFLAGPAFVGGFLATSVWLAAALLMLGTACLYTYIAPTFAQVHMIAAPRMRATAAAVLFLIINLVGLGLGPPIIGLVSDHVAANSFDPSAPGRFAAICKSAAEAGCTAAGAAGIKAGMLVICPLLPIAALFFWRAGVAIGAAREAGDR